MAAEGKEEPRWQPLESNPDVLNKFMNAVGGNADLAWHDVFGLDPELLMMLPQPIHAMMLLFPMTEKSAAAAKAQEDAGSQICDKVPDNVFYMKQKVGNACGTIGVLHCLANFKSEGLQEGSWMKTFVDSTQDKSPEERGDFFAGDSKIKELHEAHVSGGDNATAAVDDVDNHFIVFVQKNGKLYELDGRKRGVVDHGDVTPDDFCARAAGVIQTEFMQKDPENLNFTIVALGNKC
jgi:ubiquitin carboxyl-terminal hydrolase L3